MIRKQLLAVLWIAVLALLPTTTPYAFEESFDITTKIVEVQDSNPTIVAILIPDLGLVHISNEGKGKELQGHVGATAEIKARFNEKSLVFLLEVINYKIVEPK